MVDALRARGVATTAVDVEFRGGASYGSLGGRVAASWPAGRSLVRAAAVVREVMEREGTQVVHSNGMRGHVLLPLLRRRDVATVASIRDLPRSRVESVVLTAALRSADTVIATSDYVRRQLRFTRNVQVIDNPVCVPRLPNRDEARRSMGVPRDAFVVAMLAHFHRWKGHLDLLRAVEPLDDVGCSWPEAISTEAARPSAATRCCRSRGRVASPTASGASGPSTMSGPSTRPPTWWLTAPSVQSPSGEPSPRRCWRASRSSRRQPARRASSSATGGRVCCSRRAAAGSFVALVSLCEDRELQVVGERASAVVDRFDPRRHAGRCLRSTREAPGPDRAREPRLHRWSPIGSELAPSVEGRIGRLAVSGWGCPMSANERAPRRCAVRSRICPRLLRCWMWLRTRPELDPAGEVVPAGAGRRNRHRRGRSSRRRCASGVPNVEFEPVRPEHIGMSKGPNWSCASTCSSTSSTTSAWPQSYSIGWPVAAVLWCMCRFETSTTRSQRETRC